MKKLFIAAMTLMCATSIYAWEESEWDHELEFEQQEGEAPGSPLSLMNFNLNRQGDSIVARAGEKIFSTLNFTSDSLSVDPNALYQIVLGFDDLGPQKCIFNQLGYQFDGKEGILSFFCEVPSRPGVYDVKCNITSARSSEDALKSWWNQSELDTLEKVIVGRIIVK